jgi:serine/threonine protein phosphatase 1
MCAAARAETVTEMVRSIFSWSKRGEEAATRSSVPAGQFVVAVGDVHGRLDLLEMLWHQIDAASRLSSARQRTLVFVGDYIDRGMHSAELIDRLLEGFPGFETIFLKGNHDETLLQFLTDPTVGDVWRNFGGLETLRSYGVSHGPGKSWSQTRGEFAAAIPKSHVDFFKNLKLHVTIGDYLFVHAGLKPRVPLENQRESDLLWIREEFLDSTVNFGRIIVHGHTPTETPDIRPNRIGIDTGAYMTGNLTALVLEERSRRFLSTT